MGTLADCVVTRSNARRSEALGCHDTTVEDVDAATNAGPHEVDGSVWNQRGLSQEKVLEDLVPTSL